MTNVFVRQNAVAIIAGVVLTAVSYGLGLYFQWITEISWLEAFSVFASYWCTILCVFQTRFNYVVGAVAVAALGFLFYRQNLLASMALQIYLFPTLLYGWFRWKSDIDTRPVTHVGFDGWLFGYAGIVAVSYVLGVYLNSVLGGSNTWIDTSIFVASILAQFMLDNKKLENWIVWIAVDVVSVWLYWHQDLKILAIQMGLFGLNAVWGYYEWNKSRETDTFDAIYSAAVKEFKADNVGKEIVI